MFSPNVYEHTVIKRHVIQSSIQQRNTVYTFVTF